jgi:ATP-dependent phosphoenolpyruvate carboxykinase
VAGTERGVKDPTATFSACFGAAFLTLHPTKYADLLQKKLEGHGTATYLVNTGWTGGGYGTGKRMSIKATRACIDAILDGSIKTAEFSKDPVFGFEVPKALQGVPANVCDPRQAWADKGAYDAQRLKLAEMFKKNYAKYQIPGVTDYAPHGPKV